MKETRQRRVREPLQVYLAEEERRLLDRLAGDAGVSRAEILRRGILAVAREREPWDASPVLDFVRRVVEGAPSLPEDVALRHDDYLADEARGSE